MPPVNAVERLYELIAELANGSPGAVRLADAHGRMPWAERGVYVVLDPTEPPGGGHGRVVRVGTHGVSRGTSATAWSRLHAHRGTTSGGNHGNHRGSIFRLLVGEALMARGEVPSATSWGIGSSRGAAAARCGLSKTAIREAEAPVEHAVSAYIGELRAVLLPVGDAPGPQSDRARIERGLIGLLAAQDLIGPEWLGHHARPVVRSAGLWNQQHVEAPCTDDILPLMERYVGANRPGGHHLT